MTARMLDTNRGRAQFPYVSVLVTGGHTEIVLTRGVGLHTVFGFTVDIGVGTFLDRVAEEVRHRDDLLGNEE